MMKFTNFLGAALGLMGAVSGWADTVTLKTGEKLEGKVTSETDTEVVMEVKVTASIVDARTIPKAEVAQVEKTSPEEVAWAPLQALKPGANSQAAAAYDAAIASLQAFVNQFPASAHNNEASQTLVAFAEEKRRVEGGEIKIAGKWLSAEEVQRERYQISAQLQLAQMQDQAKRNDLVGALNTFDKLEKSAPGARVFPEAVTLARQILPNVKTIVERSSQNLKVRMVERQEGLKITSEPERSRLIAVQAQEDRASEAQLQAALKANVKWTPLLPGYEKSLQTLAGKLTTEDKRLEALPVAKMRQSIQVSDSALQASAKQDPATAAKTFREAITLWPTNEQAIRMEKEAIAAAAPKATPVPVVAEATPAATPTATPVPRPAVVAAPVPGVAPIVVSEEKGFIGSGLFYAVLAVVVLGGIFLVMKMRRKKQESDDTVV